MFTTALAQLQSSFPKYPPKKIYCTESMYSVFKDTSYKIVPFTKLNKHLHYDTSETEVNINIIVTDGSEKFWKKKSLRLPVS
jgi:hypothetical protein